MFAPRHSALLLVCLTMAACDDGDAPAPDAAAADVQPTTDAERSPDLGAGGAVTKDAGPTKDSTPEDDAKVDAHLGADAAPKPDAGPPPDGEYLPEPDPAIPTDDTLNGLSALREVSTRPPEVIGVGGRLRLVLLDAPLPDAPDALSGALAFLETHGKLWHVGDVREGLFLKRERLVEGGRLLVFGQRVANQRVDATEIAVEVREGRVTSVQGEWQDTPISGLEGDLTAAEAVERALAAAGQGASALGTPKRVWVPTDAGGLTDAWQVQVAGPEQSMRISVARTDGVVVRKESLTLSDGPVRNAAIFHARNETSDLCWFLAGRPKIWEDVRLPAFPAGDADAVSAERTLPAIIDYFRDVFGHDGWNRRGGANHAYVHYGVNFTNAQWHGVCQYMQFGDAVASDDVIAHEYTHGVVQATAGLVYENEPGGLNESFADIFATLFTDDERIGENGILSFCPSLGRNQLRSMADPTNCGNPDHVLAAVSGDGQGQRPNVAWPDAVDNDVGWVHTNSSLQNKAAWLLAKGGDHNGFAIRAFGNVKTGRLFYRTLSRRITSRSTFAEAARLALDEAERMVGERADDFAPGDACNVRNAFASVGLLTGDADCDGRLDAAETDDDADGVLDARDNCPAAPNPAQADVDRDGLGDPCDADADGDGFRNGSDNCAQVANPDQADADADGRGDMCDDADTDRVLDVRDNCPDAYNPDQRDTDRDGRGNPCDDDDDGDARLDAVDGCPLSPNIQVDNDADTVEDACDNCQFTANPDQGNLDGDGAGDACDDDEDGDGFFDAFDPCPFDADIGAGALESQLDLDGDGVPTACDPDEQAWLNGASQGPIESFIENLAQEPVRLPIGPCLQCPDYLPGDTTIQVQVEAPLGALTRVVDDAGTVVGQPNVGQEFQIGPLQSLYFDAAADVSYRAPGGAPDAATFIGRRYFLEILPPPAEPGVGFPLSVYVRSNLP